MRRDIPKPPLATWLLILIIIIGSGTHFASEPEAFSDLELPLPLAGEVLEDVAETSEARDESYFAIVLQQPLFAPDRRPFVPAPATQEEPVFTPIPQIAMPVPEPLEPQRVVIAPVETTDMEPEVLQLPDIRIKGVVQIANEAVATVQIGNDEERTLREGARIGVWSVVRISMSGIDLEYERERQFVEFRIE